MKKLFWILALAPLAITACGWISPLVPYGDEVVLINILNKNLFFNKCMIDDNDKVSVVSSSVPMRYYSSAVPSATLRFSRKITNFEKKYIFEKNGDSVTVQANFIIKGNLYVDENSDATWETRNNADVATKKEFELEYTRYGKLEKSDAKWKLQEVSLGEIKDREKDVGLAVKNVKIYLNKAATPNFQYTSPVETIALTNSSFVIKQSDSIYVTVEISNSTSNDAYVFLHWQGKSDKGKMAMYDDGVHGEDQTADDNIYSVSLQVDPEQTTGEYRSIIDVVFKHTMTENGKDDHEGVAWTIPFIIEGE